MANTWDILLGAGFSLVLWTLLGLPIALRLVAARYAFLLAPAFGWSLSAVCALPLFSVIGLSRLSVVGIATLVAIIALTLVIKNRRSYPILSLSIVTSVALAGAALLAVIPTLAIVPKEIGGGVSLAWPIFDHSKIAMIDEIIRSGVPAINPFYNEAGAADGLTYYYLWHFSAALLAAMTGLNGWEADAALTWFTAYAGLSTMMGLAAACSGYASSAVWVVVLAATASVRPVASALLGETAVRAAIGEKIGFGDWLFQLTWAPQHAASAMCVVLAGLVLVRLAQRPHWLTAVVLGLVGAAGYQSSVWVGGVVFGLSALAVCAVAVIRIEQHQRISYGLHLAIAGAITVVLAAPFLLDQAAMAAARETAFPIAVRLPHFFAETTPPASQWWDIPMYWLLYLPAEFPAIYPLGVLSIIILRARTVRDGSERSTIGGLAALTAISLLCAWLLVSTVADNNDLGWRAVLPALMVLIPFAAAGLSRLTATRTWSWAALAIVGIFCGLPETVQSTLDNALSRTSPAAVTFARSEAMWTAVQQATGKTDRIANNPLFLGEMTPWPVNISWALLSNRRSCYAGNELALAFAPVPHARRAQIDALFVRVFAGKGTSDDITELAVRFRCDAIVVTPEDGAWINDPFASSGLYRLFEERPNDWRIYQRVSAELKSPRTN